MSRCSIYGLEESVTNKVVMDVGQRGRSGGSVGVLETVLYFYRIHAHVTDMVFLTH